MTNAMHLNSNIYRFALETGILGYLDVILLVLQLAPFAYPAMFLDTNIPTKECKTNKRYLKEFMKSLCLLLLVLSNFGSCCRVSNIAT